MNLGISAVTFGNLSSKNKVQRDDDGLDKIMNDAVPFPLEEVWNQNEADFRRAQIEYSKRQSRVKRELEAARKLGLDRF